MPAALLMSNLQAGLHLMAEEQYSLNQTTLKLNRLIYHNTTSEKYITFFVMKLNATTGEFQFVNAGHNPPYLFGDDEQCKTLDDGGIILGMMPETDYKLGHGFIKAGQCLVMFTDGVTEAMNEKEEEFSESGVIKFMQKEFRNNSSETINIKLLNKLTEFSNGDPTRGDDITILTIKSLP
jgi:sigma-B regulation protein RsbU (phosphoserine phosphatase)